jgi:hypothetical protein
MQKKWIFREILFGKNLNRNFDKAGKIIATYGRWFYFYRIILIGTEAILWILVFLSLPMRSKKMGLYKEAYKIMNYGADITEIE